MPRKAKTPTTGTDTKEKTNQRHQDALDLLERKTNDICNRIADGAGAYARASARSRSVSPKVVEAGFQKILEAIQRGRDFYVASQRKDEVATVSRVDLRTL